MQITTIGLDIAKNVFQVHAVGSDRTVNVWTWEKAAGDK